MRILLQPATAATRYDPLPRLFEQAALPERSAFATVVASSDSEWPLGRCWLPDDSSASPVTRELATLCVAARRGEGANRIARLAAAPSIETFIGPLEPPVRLLLLGGGPDALAVVNQAGLLGWSVTAIDHRPGVRRRGDVLAATERVLLMSTAGRLGAQLASPTSTRPL